MPGAEETFPVEPGAAVKAPKGKMFAVSVTTAEPLAIPHHLNKRHWITIRLNADVPDTRVKELVEDSDDLVGTAGLGCGG